MSNHKAFNIPTGLPVLSTVQQDRIVDAWNLSEEKARIDASNERLNRRIEVLCVGGFSQIDRNRAL